MCEANRAIFPYTAFSDLGGSSQYLYVYGRQLPFRSYYPADYNNTVEPMSRVIEPTVLEYAPIMVPADMSLSVVPTKCQGKLVIPARASSFFGGYSPLTESVPTGAQVAQVSEATNRVLKTILVVVVAVAAILLLMKLLSK